MNSDHSWEAVLPPTARTLWQRCVDCGSYRDVAPGERALCIQRGPVAPPQCVRCGGAWCGETGSKPCPEGGQCRIDGLGWWPGAPEPKRAAAKLEAAKKRK